MPAAYRQRVDEMAQRYLARDFAAGMAYRGLLWTRLSAAWACGYRRVSPTTISVWVVAPR
jgi:hypothetical protein